jgi:hypothetical protein
LADLHIDFIGFRKDQNPAAEVDDTALGPSRDIIAKLADALQILT